MTKVQLSEKDLDEIKKQAVHLYIQQLAEKFNVNLSLMQSVYKLYHEESALLTILKVKDRMVINFEPAIQTSSTPDKLIESQIEKLKKDYNSLTQ